MTGYKIKELYKLLEALIDDGYGNREFQLSYDGDLSIHYYSERFQSFSVK